jgi:hypothetical protein
MKRVFVTQYPMRRNAQGDLVPVHDVTPATEYGSLEILLPGGPVVLSTEHLVRTLKQKLATFTDDDYLLCMGDPAVIAVASSIAAMKNGGRMKLLIWNRQTNKYLAVEVDLYHNKPVEHEA